MVRAFNSAKYGTITVTMTSGFGRGNDHGFKVDKVITSQEAGIIQERMGYHPAGYSFHSFRSFKQCSTWKCWTSCD